MRLGAPILLLIAGCGGGPSLSMTQLQDPQSCVTCHPDHSKQWAASMHAYASDDPVFRAMNARGQRETNGQLGSFCVNCHAPMAVRSGATTDGLNLDSLPAAMHGVTCYFCHSVDQVTDSHNAPLALATDGVMRGGISDPVANTAHNAAYSALHDRQEPDSATLCGSCHDIVNPLGVPIERTFKEWQTSVYQQNTPETLRTCGKCHMPGSSGLAAQAPGVELRLVHDHSMPAVDQALTPFPDVDVQQGLIATQLETAMLVKMCVAPMQNDTDLMVWLDNSGVGHALPSGASQDRRMWVQITASKQGQTVYTSGVVPDGMSVTDLNDPQLWLLRDVITDSAGKETHDFWAAASYTTSLLPPGVTNNPADPRYYHAVMKGYTLANLQPDKINLQIQLQAIGTDVTRDLVATGDLDPSVPPKVPTYTLATTAIEWDLANGYGCVGAMF